MDKQQLIALVHPRLKLIRTEREYTQDQMADSVGISKKTLVQLEKGRQELGWTVAVAICAVYRESTILRAVLGEDPVELVEMAVHSEIHSQQLTGAVVTWWTDIGMWQQYKLQQHTVSGHYRIIGEGNQRLYSSAVKEKALAEFKKYMDIMN